MNDADSTNVLAGIGSCYISASLATPRAEIKESQVIDEKPFNSTHSFPLTCQYLLNLKGPAHSKNENLYFLAPALTKRTLPILVSCEAPFRHNLQQTSDGHDPHWTMDFFLQIPP